MVSLNNFFKKKEYKKLFSNITNFSLFQATNILVPLLTIPYIVRVIGVEKFGILSFAQALCQYFWILTDYGFNISGTQKIAQQRDNKEKRNIIFSNIFYIKSLIMILCFGILLLLLITIDSFTENYLVYFFTFGIVPANILLSVWFFTGMEEMQYLNYANFVHRIGYVIGIFVLINDESDFYLIPAINSGFMIIAGLTSLWFIIRNFKIAFVMSNIVKLKLYLNEGWHVFLSNFAINLYHNSNVFILGIVGSKEMVGIYSAGEKLVKVFQSMFVPIIQSLYPYISRQRAKSSQKSLKSILFLLKVLGLFTAVFSILLIFGSEIITKVVLGQKFLSSIKVIQISSFVIFFGVTNYIVGIIFMMNFGMKKHFFYSVVATGIFSVLVCFSLSFFWYEIGTSVAFISSEAFLLLNMFFYIYRNKNQWSTINGS